MPGHHVVPRFLIARWQGQDGQVTLADLEDLVVRDDRPDDLDARPDFNRLQLHDDPEALEQQFFGALESNAARAIDELVTSRPPVEHTHYARANGLRPGQLLKGKRAVRFAQFLAAQAVRGPDWRKEANAHTAAAIAAEIEKKVRADPDAATDPEEIERLNGLLGLRYQARVEGDTLPQLAATLTTSIGQVLYCEYVPTVVRMPAPLLCLGNDPLVFINKSPTVGVGSYSQIATRRGNLPFSVRRDVASFISAAVDIVRGHEMIAMPVDPQHAVVLYPLERLPLPGMYPVGAEFGRLLNGVATVASRRWLVVPPGRAEAARHTFYRASPELRKADLHRAEKGLPLHTDPGAQPTRLRRDPRRRNRSVQRETCTRSRASSRRSKRPDVSDLVGDNRWREASASDDQERCGRTCRLTAPMREQERSERSSRAPCRAPGVRPS